LTIVVSIKVKKDNMDFKGEERKVFLVKKNNEIKCNYAET